MPNIELKYEWSDIEARFVFKLYKYILHSVTYASIFIAEGDYNWAKRASEHYKINMPRGLYNKEKRNET